MTVGEFFVNLILEHLREGLFLSPIIDIIITSIYTYPLILAFPAYLPVLLR